MGIFLRSTIDKYHTGRGDLGKWRWKPGLPLSLSAISLESLKMLRNQFRILSRSTLIQDTSLYQNHMFLKLQSQCSSKSSTLPSLNELCLNHCFYFKSSAVTRTAFRTDLKETCSLECLSWPTHLELRKHLPTSLVENFRVKEHLERALWVARGKRASQRHSLTRDKEKQEAEGRMSEEGA